MTGIRLQADILVTAVGIIMIVLVMYFEGTVVTEDDFFVTG